jgi:alpha-tubulin suppressor-like RCC1 family protein
MRSRLAFVPLLVTLFACSDRPITTSPNAGTPRFDIADAARDYKRGFYWLPPVVQQPNATGTFDATLSPTVEICELVAGACGSVLATYPATTADGKYHVNWHTDAFALSYTSTYRVSVRAGIDNVLLGYIDVQPASNGSGLKNVDTDEFMGLVDGRTLPIKFRIETGVIGNVTLQPLEATIEAGVTQQFVAIVTDLHGNPIAADVVWSTSNENVATVDQTGLATAVAEGIATITATSDRIAGTATLTVLRRGPVVGNVAVQPSEATIDQGTTHQFGAIVTDTDGNPMIADVVWSSSDENIATVDQTGLATAVAAGIATITATSDGVAGTASLTVEAVVGNVTVQPLEATVDAGNTHQFVAIVTDLRGNPMVAQVVWSSSDESVATVDQTGLATGVAEGSATITATADNVARTATLTVLGLGGTIIMSAGGGHTCALNATGIAFCWGLGGFGQLGNGGASDSPTPVAVAGGLTFATLGTGTNRTCAVTRAGAAYCWGSALLGDGGSSDSPTPVAVAGGHTFGRMSVGALHACAIATDGRAYCWGSGASGRLGNGFVDDQVAPSGVSGDITFASITAGQAHTCGLDADGAAYCWGLGTWGRLGNGGLANQSLPTAVSGGITFASISAGSEHTCAIGTDGVAYCWGRGLAGRLGTGTQDDQLAPAPVPVPEGRTFAAIAAGENHTCAITTGGLAYCWGSNSAGQLGNGSLTPSLVPTPVSGGLTFASITAGASYTCGVTTSDELYCWGFGNSGQLGNGTLTSRFTPARVATFP